MMNFISTRDGLISKIFDVFILGWATQSHRKYFGVACHAMLVPASAAQEHWQRRNGPWTKGLAKCLSALLDLNRSLRPSGCAMRGIPSCCCFSRFFEQHVRRKHFGGWMHVELRFEFELHSCVVLFQYLHGSAAGIQPRSSQQMLC